MKKLCEDTFAIGYIDCDTIYFDDNRINFEDVIHVCGELPCLFLAYNKEFVHVYCRVPKV